MTELVIIWTSPDRDSSSGVGQGEIEGPSPVGGAGDPIPPGAASSGGNGMSMRRSRARQSPSVPPVAAGPEVTAQCAYRGKGQGPSGGSEPESAKPAKLGLAYPVSSQCGSASTPNL